MDFPKELKYTKDHEWISPLQGKTAKIGVSAYAIEHLGDIVHVELPEVGATIEAGESFGSIESTKAVSDMYMPVGGKIVEVNKAIAHAPERLQVDAYEEGWLAKIEVVDANELTKLFDINTYKKFVDELKD